MTLISLTTDFGLNDCFVAAMKGVILSLSPTTLLVDICHDIPPQDILTGALMLEETTPYFPGGSIHVVVVDPGVGSARRPIAIETEGGYFVAPDNGVLHLALQREKIRRCVEIRNEKLLMPRISTTFHGRDIFAPAAACIARGIPIQNFGPEFPATELVKLEVPTPIVSAAGIEAHVLRVDHYGNLVTNLSEEIYKRAAQIGLFHAQINDELIGPVQNTFSDVAEGKPVAYIGSAGKMEIAVRGGHAGKHFNAKRGTVVWLKPAVTA